jgi:hypothetical protein
MVMSGIALGQCPLVVAVETSSANEVIYGVRSGTLNDCSTGVMILGLVRWRIDSNAHSTELASQNARGASQLYVLVTNSAANFDCEKTSGS